MEKKEITQADMQEMFLPILRQEGKSYRKTQQVLARKAVEGERINTVTKDGHETTNVADADDYVVQNLTDTGEQYIIDSEAFKKRYTLSEDRHDEFDQYKPVLPIIAVELTEALLGKLNLPTDFHFTAAWNEAMQARQDDFLASPPDFSEVYRISRHEFFQTYTPT